MYSDSIANNFVHPKTATSCEYHSFGELTYFTYYLLQRVKQGSSLPLVEQWEQYVLANHSKFSPVSKEEFLSGMWVLAALNKIESSYWKREFRQEARRFLEEFTTSVFSTVAARSNIGEGLSCFCPALSLAGTTTRPFIFSVFCWMGFWKEGGSRAAKLRLVGLSACPLSKGNDSRSGPQRGTAQTHVTSSRFTLCTLVFALASIFSKYVS